MRVLITFGSKSGGTAGIARSLGEALEQQGLDVVVEPASEVRDVGAYGAVVVGGSVYANRWHADARRLVARNVDALRRVPVWMFSSGPLDDSAERVDVPPTTQVSVLMRRIGAQGHRTFGGRLLPDAKGFPAQAMAKTMSGDWRNPERIRAWAADIARELPHAHPKPAIDPPAHALPRLLAYGAVGWAVGAGVMAGLLQVASTSVAIGLHAVAVPLIFAAVSVRYFHAYGAREPLPVALTWTALVAILDASVAAFWIGSFAGLTDLAGTWLPLALVFLVTWLVGFLISTMPWPKPTPPAGGPRPLQLAH